MNICLASSINKKGKNDEGIRKQDPQTGLIWFLFKVKTNYN